MNLKSRILAFCLMFSGPAALMAGAQNSEQDFIRENMEFAARQYGHMLQTPRSGKAVMPHSMRRDGTVAKGTIQLWTAGFFPGSLWYLSAYLNDRALQDSALVYTRMMEPSKTYTGNHDIGFMMYCSYGNALRFAPQPEYKDILIQSAQSLCTRFRPKAGIIQSWNGFRSWHGDKVYDCPVIIDNMMNLELLFYASKATGDDKYRDIAIQHAENTLKNHVRKDYSCYHIVYYDKATGAPIKGETSQGYADNSAWARGQAWAIYGFTMCYRETRDKRFLKAARRLADFYLNHPNLPSDGIPWWDFNAYQPGFEPGKNSGARIATTNYRDASAAACTASALLELSTYCSGKAGQRYLDAARHILHTLGSPVYRAKEGENANFVLMHSTGALPQRSEIDVPLTYADYYFIEALYRYNLLLQGKPLF